MQPLPLLEVHGSVSKDKILHSGTLVFYKTANGAAYVLEIRLDADRGFAHFKKEFTPDKLKQIPMKNNLFRSAVFITFTDGVQIKFKSGSPKSLHELVTFLNEIKAEGWLKAEIPGRNMPYARTRSEMSPRNSYSLRHSPVVKSPSGKRLPQNSSKLRQMKDCEEDFVLEIVGDGKKSTTLSPQSFFNSNSAHNRSFNEGRSPLKTLNINANQDDSKRQNLDMSKRPRLSCDVIVKEEKGEDEQHTPNTADFFPQNQPEDPPSPNSTNQANENVESRAPEENPYNGFPNIGNSCFMNSVLQSLLQLRCISDNLDSACLALEKTLPEQSVVRYLVSLLSCRPEDCQHILGQTLEVICNTSPCFADGQQHDALEFLIQLLDVIKEEVKKASGGNSDHCPVSNNIEFQLGSSYICEKCQRTISRREVLHMVSLNVLNTEGEAFSSFSDALKDYFEPQLIEMTCERCSGPSTKCIQGFSTLPRVLVFHLKRYTYNQGTSKIVSPVQVPVHLSVEEFLLDKTLSSTQPVMPSPAVAEAIVPNTKENETVESASEDLVLDCTFSSERAQVCSSELEKGFLAASSSIGTTSVMLSPIKVQQCSVPERLTLGGHCQSSPKVPIALKGGSDSAVVTSTIPTVGSEVPVEKNEGVALENGSEETEEEQMDKVLKMSLESVECQEDRELVEAMNRSVQDISSDQIDDCPVFQENPSPVDSMEDSENFAGPCSYQLASVVSHIGQNADTGHYVANYFDSKVGQWWHFNDKIVQQRSKHFVLESIKTRGYLFFYVARDSLP